MKVCADETRKCMVFNPKAGSAEEVAALEDEIERDESIKFCRTTGPGHGMELAEQAVVEGREIVMAAGGDGTVSEVVAGLMQARERHPDLPLPALLIVPLGTGNDLPRTLQLPDDPREAVALAKTGQRRPLDVTRWHLRNDSGEDTGWSVNVAAGGFSAKVTTALTPEIKRAWGPLAYTRAALGNVEELTPFRLRLKCDGETEMRRMSALNVIVANARFAGGGINVAAEADPSDGLLDVVVVHPGNFVDLAGLAARLLAGNASYSDLTDVFRARVVELEADPPMPFNVDGDFVGAGHFRFECIPGALEVIVPADFKLEPAPQPQEEE